MAHTLTPTGRASDAERRPALDGVDPAALREARCELAACFREAARLGLSEGICNHFSALVPGRDDLFLVNPYGWAFEEITASRLLVCDLDGRVVDGDGEPEATAFFIHAELHRALPRARAAFHTHMPNATALALVDGPPLAWAGQTALKFHGRVAVDANYGGLALDGSEGRRIAQAMGDADVVFLRHHGVIVTGPSIAEAWDDLYYLERAAEVQLKAMASGRPLRAVPPEIARRTHAQMRAGDPASARAHLDSVMRRQQAAGIPFDA
ncbi:aldolase [Piscinibacter sakaiensis]|uniref:Ribulose-5-phosphate 4-epimerase n=1 Tax=Piscinibacter sakaiensis TaxID=1547922 RepID=A0A0K8P836_PISS1|nr:aldolase [Piscinibacter sakaiensis]GAP38365.1 ribulose-5-phosphate 4-epimerase [Piscinibacter sakaiensis]